jgi:hypothetical protein
MNWMPDFHFLIVVTPLIPGVYPGVLRRSIVVVVRACPCVAAPKNELDARFSFPDRRHSSCSGVYQG